MAGLRDIVKDTQSKTNVYQNARAKRKDEIAKSENSSDDQFETAPKSKRGRPSAGRGAQMTITMSPVLRRRFKAYCADQDKSAAQIIEECLLPILDDWDTQKRKID